MSASTPSMSAEEAHGWIGTETVGTPLGTFEFRGGYPTEDAARSLAGQLVFNRGIELYLSQLPVVSFYRVWKGVNETNPGKPNQLVIWESLMDAQTLLLTGNTETVYGLGAIDLKRDGPVVIEVPPGMLGGISSLWQGEIAGIGPKGADQGEGGKFLLLPPDYAGTPPPGYLTTKSPTYRVVLGVRGFQVDGKTDAAVAAMKTTRVYPLSKAANPPAMTFINGSGQPIDTIFPDNDQFFDDLYDIVASEPAANFTTTERFQLASIGIEPGKRFSPNEYQSKRLYDAARVGAAMARGNAFASTDAARLVYPDRRWEWAFVGGSATWDAQGYVNTDRRAAFAYIAIGMSPAMVEQVVGQGSQYLWTPRDTSGAFLDGGKRYHLHLPPDVPVKMFWSVVVYDAVSRSMLQNGEKFPTVSQYTGPDMNTDGSVDIYFGPVSPAGHEKNWVKTVAGRGWFPILRFYGPLQPFFDKSWKPADIVEVK